MNGRQVLEIARREVGRLCYLWGFPGTDRDDLVQEAAMGMLSKLHKLDAQRTDEEQRAYMAKTARTAALMYLRWRKAHVREILLDTHAEEHEGYGYGTQYDGPSLIGGWKDCTTPEQCAMASEAHNLLQLVLDTAEERMPRRERQVLARLVYGFEVQELDEIDSATVRSLARRARGRIVQAAEELGCGGLIGASECIAMFGR